MKKYLGYRSDEPSDDKYTEVKAFIVLTLASLLFILKCIGVFD